MDAPKEALTIAFVSLVGLTAIFLTLESPTSSAVHPQCSVILDALQTNNQRLIDDPEMFDDLAPKIDETLNLWDGCGMFSSELLEKKDSLCRLVLEQMTALAKYKLDANRISELRLVQLEDIALKLSC